MALPEAVDENAAGAPRRPPRSIRPAAICVVLALASFLILSVRPASADDGRSLEAAKDASRSDAKDRGGKDAGEKDDVDDEGDGSLADQAAERFPQPVRVGSLLHRIVLEPTESQPVLGHVAAVVRASDGTIDVVVDYGGFLGFGSRPIAVPIEAMTLLGRDMEIVSFTPAQLRSFPTFEAAGTMPVSDGQILNVGLSRPSH